MTAMPTLERRLATIVVIDVVGYSFRAEVDLNLILAEVAVFAELLEHAAEARGGRLFKKTGDGFLLEFSTVSGALAFTDVLRDAATLPTRTGIHVGEVAVTPQNDLLGHSVNVASRLEAMAPVNGIFVSADIVRAVQGAFGRRFTRRGDLQLQKMRETLTVYSFEAVGTRKPILAVPHFRSLARSWPVAAVVVFVIISSVAVLLARDDLPWIGQHRPLVAILDPEIITGTAGARDLANNIVHGVLDATAAAGVDAVSRSTSPSSSAHARLTVGGFLKQAADDVDVTIEIADTKEHVMLWSGTFQGALGNTTSLSAQVAYKTADILTCGADAYARTSPLTTESKRLWFKYCGYKRDPSSLPLVRDAMQALVKQAPKFASGFSVLAVATALSLRRLPPEQVEEAVREGQAAADRAIQLDPHNQPDAYLALFLFTPPHSGRKEAFVLKGLALTPNAPTLLNTEGDLLASDGRFKEAAVFARRSLALEPLSPAKNLSVINLLLDQQQTAEAYEMLDAAQQIWPNYFGVRDAMLRRALDAGNASATEKILDDPLRRPVAVTDKALAIWRRFPAALHGSPLQKAALGAELRDAILANEIDEDLAIHGLLLLGQDDVVFDEVTRQGLNFDDARRLLSPEGERFRSQTRFMHLASSLGLTSDWQASNKWPDFCFEPGLPYECRTQAARELRSQS